MTYPILTATSTTNVQDYNYIQSLVADIVGLGENGYGQSSRSSFPVTNTRQVTTSQWGALISDINFIQAHITNANTSTIPPVVGTTITTLVPNALGADIDWLVDPTRRYTCHESQYYLDPVTNTTTNTLNGVSTRITPWSKQMVHKVRVDFPTNLYARYFFNSGSSFVWRPFHNSSVGNDRDAEWSTFIRDIQATEHYEYKRDDFINTLTNTTVTTYTSGSMSISILAERRDDITSTKRIDFTATYRNDDIPDIIIAPTSGFWNVGPWEEFAIGSSSTHISGVQSASGTYSAQGGFSLDMVQGVVMLYMGAWPSDPPNNQTCEWEWLAFNGAGLNKLGDTTASNYYRVLNNIRPYWTIGGSYNLSSISTGTYVDYTLPAWPYTLVPYTYRITRTESNTATVALCPGAWDTGDNGTTVSIQNWWNNMNAICPITLTW